MVQRPYFVDQTFGRDLILLIPGVFRVRHSELCGGERPSFPSPVLGGARIASPSRLGGPHSGFWSRVRRGASNGKALIPALYHEEGEYPQVAEG